jgi:hypothetical protein
MSEEASIDLRVGPPPTHYRLDYIDESASESGPEHDDDEDTYNFFGYDETVSDTSSSHSDFDEDSDTGSDTLQPDEEYETVYQEGGMYGTPNSDDIEIFQQAGPTFRDSAADDDVGVLVDMHDAYDEVEEATDGMFMGDGGWVVRSHRDEDEVFEWDMERDEDEEALQHDVDPGY